MASPFPSLPMALPWWFLTLYRRPGRFLGLVLGVPLLVACFWIYRVSERQWRVREGEDLIIAARMTGRMLEEELSRAQAVQAAIAHRPDFVRAVMQSDREAILQDLQVLLQLSPQAARILVRDREGRMLAQVTAESDPLAPSPDAWPAAEDRQPAVSGVYLGDATSGEKVVGVSTPILEGRVPVGMVQTQYSLEAIARWLQRTRVGSSGFLYVVDNQGFLVAHPYQVLPGKPKNVSHWAPVAAALSADGRLVRFEDGKPARAWTAGVVMVAPYGWRVVAQQLDAAMLAPFYHLVYAFAAVILLLAGLLAALILRWARLHETTLELLAKQTQLLAATERRLRVLKMRRGDTNEP